MVVKCPMGICPGGLLSYQMYAFLSDEVGKTSKDWDGSESVYMEGVSST